MFRASFLMTPHTFRLGTKLEAMVREGTWNLKLLDWCNIDIAWGFGTCESVSTVVVVGRARELSMWLESQPLAVRRTPSLSHGYQSVFTCRYSRTTHDPLLKLTSFLNIRRTIALPLLQGRVSRTCFLLDQV